MISDYSKKEEATVNDSASLSVTTGEGHDGTHHHHGAATGGTPSSTYDPKLEARIRLKTDLAIIPLAALIFLFCFIDRSNIGNARLAGLEADLGLKGYDFNSVNSFFYVSYIVFEIPSSVLCKVVGPGWYLPGLTVLFGLLTVASAYVNNYSQLAACRFLLGIAEAGVMPGLSYYLSRFYRHSELTFRLSLYIVMAPLAGAFGGLLASAILKLPGFGVRIPAGSWRAILALEGIVTVVVGLLALAFLTDRPETARFLTPEEREVAINRLKDERTGNTVVLDKISKKKMLKGAINPVTATTSICFMFCTLSIQGLALFAPTIVRSIYPNVRLPDQVLPSSFMLTTPPTDERHSPAAPHRAPLRLRRRLPPHHVLRQLEAQPPTDLHDRLRPSHDDWLPHLPLHQPHTRQRPLRRHLPHGQHRLYSRAPLPCPGQRERQLRHGSQYGHRHLHVFWQHRQPRVDLVLPAQRRSQLPHRLRPQLCHVDADLICCGVCLVLDASG
jgi:MFS family permease